MKVGLALSVLALGFSWPLLAKELESETFFPQQMDAGQLLMQCSSSSMTPSGRKRQRYCDGFVSGVEETLRLADQRHNKTTLCVKAGVKARELSKAYVSYANSHKTDLEKPAAAVVMDALNASFPCP
ncbi:Rap1a/Tai family immunity protein [Aestuariirhabdus sp. LZHN29]|uniref:Rap1a/Tai family immunity protein n=1 Tax=Aestuariirhabdus sp. LZHN29 TaxID=3417462 RepID=UPI003CE751EF